jgi:hypothetical protein
LSVRRSDLFSLKVENSSKISHQNTQFIT